MLPSVLWRCLLGGRKGIRPVKNWVVGCWCGCLGWDADLHIDQQMPLPLTISCTSKSSLVWPFLVLPVMLNEDNFLKPRPRTNLQGRGQGQGQTFEAEARTTRPRSRPRTNFLNPKITYNIIMQYSRCVVFHSNHHYCHVNPSLHSVTKWLHWDLRATLPKCQKLPLHTFSRGQNEKFEDRPRTIVRGRGRGQIFEAEAEDKILASRPAWPRGLNITGFYLSGTCSSG